MQSDRYERISERAYHIWVAEGRVHGRHDEHWRQAERAIAEEEMKIAAALSERAAGSDTAETSAASTRRRPAAIPGGAKATGDAAAGKSRTTAGPAGRRGRRPPAKPLSS